MLLFQSVLIAGSLLSPTPLPGDTCSAKAASTTAWAETKDIVDTAVAAGSFKTLAAALKAADLVDALKAKGPFTVFAPTDEAFAKLPKGTLERLLDPKNKAELQAILTYHVVPASVMAEDVVKLKSAGTLNGQRVDVMVSDAGVAIDGAKVIKTDIRCSNGIVHVIDSVILPNSKDLVATAVGAGQFKTLAAALEAAGLVEALQGKGPFTVFAPTDAAFAALPAGTLESLLKPENKDQLAAILKLHVIPARVDSEAAARGASAASLQGQTLVTKLDGGAVTVNGARVVATDVDASNGVIHVIDRVLLPSATR
ncbi:MAG: fasciclin domain-containing protein [Planctomycetes bacterium]|nr:fasciclin domain-containing protein [Planctomycetota bacterium]